MEILLVLLVSLSADAPYREWFSEPQAGEALPPSVGARLSPAELEKLLGAQPILPFAELTVGVRLPDSATWIGSKRGVMYRPKNAPRWRVFHSKRWIPDDEVLDLSVVSPSEVWVKTPKGLGKLVERDNTLEGKMALINANLQKYHVRHGQVAEIGLRPQGELNENRVQRSSDNDGLWTSIYVAAEAFRYAVTKDPEAKKNARRSLETLMFLERITGIPGFAARSVTPIEDDPKKYGGEWHRSSDGKWWWKGDTSSDELDGHYFAYAIYHDVAATPEEREEIKQYVARITDHIIDHGYYYVGPPGKPTTWGVWAPKSLNHDLRWVNARGLNSLEILSHLKVAEHIVGHPRYAREAKELIEKHAYHTNTVDQKLVWPLGLVNHSDDELAFLAYYPLLIYERDPSLRATYLASIRRSWLIERPEHSPLFNYIYGAALQANNWTDPLRRPDRAYVKPDAYDHDLSLEWFREVSANTIEYSVRNSGRRDIEPMGRSRAKRERGRTVAPVSERRTMRWNGDPYEFDGGSDGHERDDGAAILLPYWMGRYHRFIE